MKIILAGGAVVIAVLAILFFVLEPASAPSEIPVPEANRPIVADDQPTATATENSRRANPNQTNATQPANTGKLKADIFSGKLEEVHNGCFSDGECYVVVDGKHVTLLMGWSRATVGSVIGAPSIGDLERFIGTTVEVYAQENPDKTYTLYGSEGFYFKVPDGA